jgi:isoleucyl-tRNA synthetase
VVDRLKGEALVGWNYRGPFDELPPPTKAFLEANYTHRVIPWKEVGAAEGTGIVHIAPGCGAEDFQLSKENDLPIIAPLDENGVYVAGFDWLSGRHSQEVAEAIFDNCARRVFTTASSATPTATRTAGAAARSWSTGWWMNGSSAWASCTTSRAKK